MVRHQFLALSIWSPLAGPSLHSPAPEASGSPEEQEVAIFPVLAPRAQYLLGKAPARRAGLAALQESAPRSPQSRAQGLLWPPLQPELSSFPPPLPLRVDPMA